MAAQAVHPQEQQLVGLIQGWNRRWNTQRSIFWLPRSLLPGLVAGIALFVLSRVSNLINLTSLQIVLAGLLLALAGAAVMLGWVWLRPTPTLSSARHFDITFDLGERISTALELMEGRIHAPDELLSHQLEDAWNRGQQVQANEHLPLKWDRRAWIATGVALFMLLITLFLPGAQMPADPAVSPQQVAISDAADEVERITQEIASDTSLSDEERQELLQQLQRASDILEEEEVSPEEAFATLSDTQSELEEQAASLEEQVQQQQQGLQAASEAMQQEENQTSQSSQSGESGEGTESGEDGQQTTQSEIPQLSSTLEQAEQQMDSQSAEQQQITADNLEQAADALEATNPELAETLREAAEALRNGDTEAAQQAMQEAAQQAQAQQQQMQQQQQSSQQMQNSAQQLEQASDQIAQQSNQQTPSDMQSESPSQSSQEGQQQSSNQSQQQAEGEGQSQSSQNGQSGDQSGQQESQQPGGNSSVQPMTAGSGAGDEGGGDGSDTSSSQSAQQAAQDNDPDGLGERDFSPVYAPRRIGDGESGPDLILEPDASDAPVSEGDFVENPSGEALVPYNEVFSDYSNAANRALEGDYIPLGLRDVVHDYFSSLEPNQQR